MDEKCINLRKRFGDSYQIDSEIPGGDPWQQMIKGRRGHICPWGGELLAVCIDGRPALCERLMRQHWVNNKRSQVGDDGANAVFHVHHFHEAADFALIDPVGKARSVNRARKIDVKRCRNHVARKRLDDPIANTMCSSSG